MSKFKIGDVAIIKSKNYCGINYNIGDIVRINDDDDYDYLNQYSTLGISASCSCQIVDERDMELLTMKNLPVGTKVRVKYNLCRFDKYDGNDVVSEMEKWAGKIMAISYSDGNGEYKLEDEIWDWTYDMFESYEIYFPLTKDTTRVGMKVIKNVVNCGNISTISDFDDNFVYTDGFLRDSDMGWYYSKYHIPCKFHVDEVAEKPIKFKAGDEVICVNNNFYETSFTYGKKYTIIDADSYFGDEFVTVTSDKDRVHCYASRFELAPKDKKEVTLEEIIKKRDQEITKLKSKIDYLERRLDEICELADY